MRRTPRIGESIHYSDLRDFADAIALLEEDKMKLQQVTTALNEEATKIGLRIKAEKLKIMYVRSTAEIWGESHSDRRSLRK